MIPIIGLIAGIALGLALNMPVSPNMARYLGIALLAALDSSFGGIRANLEHTFNERLFIGGFLVNTTIAGLIVYVGDNLGIEIYLAAVVAFGVRLFQNLALIRRHFFKLHHLE